MPARRHAGNFQRLEELYMNHNRMVEIPFSLSQIPTLRTLSLSYNNILEFPYNFKLVCVELVTVFQCCHC
jgi:Leucine-rich repeat (LRR) protein